MSHLTDHTVSPDRKSTYLKNRLADIEAIRIAIKVNDFTDIENRMHKIKGNAKMFGFTELGEIAKGIELAAVENDVLILKSEIERFEQVLASYQFHD